MQKAAIIALALILGGCTTQQACKDEGGEWVVVAIRAEHRCQIKGGYAYTVEPCEYKDVKGCRFPQPEQSEQSEKAKEEKDFFDIIKA